MAAGTIFTVLSNIPWGAVVDSAPKVAEGASKLWNAVAKWSKSDPVQNGEIDAIPQKPMSELERLQTHLNAVEESVRSLNDQMQTSSQLLKELAEQNIKLVQRIELNRRRLMQISLSGGLLIATLFTAVLFLLLRQ